jgi:methionyl aminopeptidase
MWTDVASIGTKTADEIELMRAAGRLVAQIQDAIGELARPGGTTQAMDELARRMIEDAGAEALFLGVENPQARLPLPGGDLLVAE